MAIEGPTVLMSCFPVEAEIISTPHTHLLTFRCPDGSAVQFHYHTDEALKALAHQIMIYLEEQERRAA